MSDFVSEFWNWYVTLIVLISIIACGVFLWSQSIHRPESGKSQDTTGHVWDENLEEYNNPLPRWWMWLFYITVVFSLVYVVLYPALGRFPGIFGWSTADQHKKEVAAADEKVKPLFDKYLKMELAAVAADKEAMEMGSRLFQTYCMQCHGATGEGSRDKGFPNLTSKTYSWGNAPEQILETISNGRTGVMPPRVAIRKSSAVRRGRRKSPTMCVPSPASSMMPNWRSRARHVTIRSALPVTAPTARAWRHSARRT